MTRALEEMFAMPPTKRKRTKPRHKRTDYQRSRVYRAEDVCGGEIFFDQDQIEAYVKKFTTSAWWKTRFPKKTNVTVYQGKRNAWAWGSAAEKYISIPNAAWARKERIVLHELAHVAAPLDEHHGPIYAGILLALIDKKMGREEMLKVMSSYRAHNVDFKMPKWWRN